MLSESFEPFLRVLNDIFQYFMGVLTRDRGGIASENGHLAPQQFLGVLNDLFRRLTSSKSILLTFIGGA